MTQDAVEELGSPSRAEVPSALGGAFACPESDLPVEDRDEMIDSIARRVVERGLAIPAAFLLEMHKPLCFLGSQLLLLGSPILGPFVGFGRVARFSSLIENRENVELLLRRIEELSAGEAGDRAPCHDRPSRLRRTARPSSPKSEGADASVDSEEGCGE